MIQRTLRARISSLESPDDIARAFLQFVRAFAFGHQVYPVRFSFPVFLAQASIRTKTTRPNGSSIAPINASTSNSCETAESGAPARCAAAELVSPTPNNLRQADKV